MYPKDSYQSGHLAGAENKEKRKRKNGTLAGVMVMAPRELCWGGPTR